MLVNLGHLVLCNVPILQDGKLHQGVFRMARGSIEAHIASEALGIKECLSHSSFFVGEDILIQGWDSINRAVEMGIVSDF